MKMKLWMTTISVVGLGLAGYFYWRFHRDPSLYVRAALKRGEDMAAQKVDLAKACAREADNMKTFCIEGFYYQSAIDDLSDTTRSMAGILEDEIKRFEIRTSPSRSVWAVAFGLALIKTDRSLKETEDYLAELRPLLFAYVVDGWALEAAGKWGAPTAAAKCTSDLAKEWRGACLWGIGSGHFFYPENQANLNEPLIRGGFEFASHFTQPGFMIERDILRLQNGGARTAELAKHLYQGQPPENEDLRRAAACLTYRHVTECL
jgi:hypothetical protein